MAWWLWLAFGFLGGCAFTIVLFAWAAMQRAPTTDGGLSIEAEALLRKARER